ncbi:MAG: MFS transporter [Sphingobacteriales bacterium]|nr:MAG: MFS transporter [Sphingobacteriales bacterium]
MLATISPLLLVAIATRYGWRNAFFLAGIPGLILAGIGYFFIREKADSGLPGASHLPGKSSRASIVVILRQRNVWVSILMGSCIMTWLFAQVTFLPKFLVSSRDFTEKDMAISLSLFGLGVIAWGLVGPALSDKFGRKPVVLFSFLLSLLLPFGVIYYADGLGMLSPYLFFGAAGAGAIPIVLATIPSETAPSRYLGQTLGLVMGICELVGGFLAPVIAGWSADRFGGAAPFFLAAAAAVAAGLFACLLHETAPAVTASRTGKRFDEGKP